MLWHQRLGHVSKERLKSLVKSGVIGPLDFSDFSTCLDCIRGKLTKLHKFESDRSTDLLQLIHTDIYGPFPTPSLGRQRYFITFIDDFSRYAYVFLIHQKSDSLDVFKIFQLEVEHQLNRKIKVVRSDRGGEYYGKIDQDGQHSGPFYSYLQSQGIVAQYTTPCSPKQNGVCERRNRT